MRYLGVIVSAAVLSFVSPARAADAPAPGAALQNSPAAITTLFTEWRAFVKPKIAAGVPDYGPAAMARMATALPHWQARLAALDRRGWNLQAQNDFRLIEAEMNALDFNLRVLKPWARDPSFYQTVFGEESDVPAHEGPSAQPNIDLFAYDWPLSKADDARLTVLIGAFQSCLPMPRSTSPPEPRMTCGRTATAPSSSRAGCWRSSRRERCRCGRSKGIGPRRSPEPARS